MEHWKRNDYTTKNISLDSSSDEDEEEEEESLEEEEEGVDIRYMVGDVTRPQCAGKDDAIVVHCVGKYCSGSTRGYVACHIFVTC